MISLIETIVRQLTGRIIVEEGEDDIIVPPFFYHGLKSWQNLVADDESFDTAPAVYLDEPIMSYDDIKQSGYIEEGYPLKLLFIDKSEPDWTPAEHQVVIAKMRTLRRQFLNKLQQSDTIRHVADSQTTDVVNLFDTNVSGVFLEVTIYLYNTESSC